MNNNARASAKVLVWVLAVLCLVGVGGAMLFSNLSHAEKAPAENPSNVTSLRLMPGTTNTLELTPQLINTLGVRTVQVKSAVSHERLSLSGSLFLDSNRMVRVHSRFAGEVVSIGTIKAQGPAGPHDPDSQGGARPLRLGDRVVKGQVLAVIWSKDVGEKKSDLVNALSKLYLDEAQLKSLRSLGDQVVGLQKVREAERAREADIIEVDRVERTLRSWRLPESEINVVRSEAEKIHRGDVSSNMDVDKTWAEVTVRSPFDGIVLEKNIVGGDIVDTSLDLFRIADLSVLGVMANVYEEDLPALESLKPEQQKWTVFLKSQSDAPGISGTFDLIGSIVDPYQHSAAVMGWLDNKQGRLRAGQFITASVELPAAAGEVLLPDTAVIQDGSHCIVFVASDATGKEVTRRTIALVSRGQDVAFARAQPTAEEEAQGCQPLAPGEWVVASGSIELDGALENALATMPQREAVKN